MSANPLLERHELPPFDRIKPEHVTGAVEEILASNRSTIAEMLDELEEPTWAGFFLPLDELEDRLEQAWSPVRHMNAVVSSEALREAHNECLARITEYHTELGQNRDLFEAYERYAASKEFETLGEAQRKSIENALRDFRLSGVGLPDRERERFAEISRRLSQLGSRFSDNILDATDAWIKQITDEDELEGLPASALESARQAAETRGMEGLVLTLEAPSYVSVMTYCDSRELRRELYEAYTTRASDQGPHAGKWDNGPIIMEILSLRRELAGLLGFGNYAERSLAAKMARSTEEVMAFLNELTERGLPVAKREFEELSAFAAEEYGVDELEAWDLPYYSEKQRLAQFEVSQEELRPYFPAPQVVKGLFEVARRLFDIEIHEVSDREVWHPDVRCFDIRRGGETIARFYMDLYARRGKQGGAWMDECRVRRRRVDGAMQLPVAYLTCNFTGPVGDDPALLRHGELVTLFHEFGHGLHHMLTRVDVGPVSGINGVAWDAVELPSQFLENWCWQPEALEFISGHYETGECLPTHLLERMVAAKNFQAAMAMVRQLEFGLFDFRLHIEYDGGDYEWMRELLDEVRSNSAVMKPPGFNRFENGFPHIFAGPYAAGYYSYKWAEVLSADAFSRFMASGIFDRQTGEQFLSAVLERGGSSDALDLFVTFMGREPEIDALLRQDGIIA